MRMDRIVSRIKRHYFFSLPTLIAGVVLTIFALLFFIAPATLPPGSVDLGEEGTTIPDEKTNITKDMPPFQKWAYEFGDATCHQKASRSFFINGNEMPLCARCATIYLGLAIGTLITAFMFFELKIWIFLIGLAPMAIDGIGQTILGLWESTNLLRVLTGLPAGLVSGIAVGYIITTIYVEIRLKRYEE